jgi:membrane-associated protein
MGTIKYIIDLFLHVDKNLTSIVTTYGGWSYALLFGVIFMETGFVVTPFLPGDSLLFAAGALAAFAGPQTGAFGFNIVLLWILMVVAAFVGDTVNYWIGHFIGPKAFESNNKFLKKEYLEKAQKFYDKHGGKAIVLARFVPIVRTFAPFVAGVGKMNYLKFISFNAIGGLLWVSLFLLSGYFFGNIPLVKHNFEIVIVVIVLISAVPILMEVAKAKKKK